MKKLLSIVLALAMVLALGVTAFAEEVPAGNITGETSGTVTATYNGGEDSTPAVYAVNITWNIDSTLAYSTAGTTYTWNAETLKYGTAENGTAGWSGTASVTVTVTNRSNQSVNAAVTQTPGAGLTLNNTWTAAENGGSPAGYNNNAKELASADTGVDKNDPASTGTAQVVAFATTIEAANITAGTIDANTTVATITVTLTK